MITHSATKDSRSTMIELLIASLSGLILHQSTRYTDRMPDGWRELSNYAIGVSGSLPIIGLFWWRLAEIKTPWKRAFVSYLLGFLGVGAGVAGGWLIDTIRREK